MQKLLLAIVFIVGCDEDDPLGNCILQYGGIGNGSFYKCYANVYTKKECLDKTTGPDGEFDYHSYVDQTCFKFCSDICGGGYPSDCQNPDVRSCVEY